MTSSVMHKFYQVLQDRKAGLLLVLRQRLDLHRVSPNSDPVDGVAELTEQELCSRMIAFSRTRVRHLEDSLWAIQNGSYGRCAACDGEIPLKRLEAVPWSTYCVACHEKAEAAQASRDTQQVRRPPRELENPSEFRVRRVSVLHGWSRGCLPPCPRDRYSA